MVKHVAAFAVLEFSADGLSACCKDCMENYTTKTGPQVRRGRGRASITPAMKVARAKIKTARRSVVHSHNVAMKLVRIAVKRGELKKQNCTVCGDKFSQPCHADPMEPLKIEWFCLKHHPYAIRCNRCRELRVAVDYPIMKKNVSCRSGVCKTCKKGESYVINAERRRALARQQKESERKCQPRLTNCV